jgi:hypothetical protein
MDTHRRLPRKPILGSTALAIALLTSRSAVAAELYTALVRANSSATVNYRCQVTNVGTSPIVVALTLINSAGVLENTPTDVTVQPNGTLAAVLPGEDAGGVFCRASGQFSKKKVTMSLQLTSTAGVTQLAVPAQ